ncbi:hypothetical protein M5689_013631 [Euphorbia peplus]|nr:hypothetical protein M5689_013631 [Euphorbia peplus]
MAAARYLAKKDGVISSMKASYSLMKLHYSSSPSYAARVSSTRDEDLGDRDHHEKSTIGHVEESAKEGVRKATELADAAKQNLDGAWESTKAKILESTENNENEEDKVVAEIKKLDGPVDTVDYRNMQDSNL